MIEAEKAFMEQETKKLQARFQKEKEELHARFVAERQTGYGTAAEAGLEVCERYGKDNTCCQGKRNDIMRKAGR